MFTWFNQSGCIDVNFVLEKKVGEPWDCQSHRYLEKYIKKTVIFSIDLWFCTETNFSLHVFIEAISLL